MEEARLCGRVLLHLEVFLQSPRAWDRWGIFLFGADPSQGAGRAETPACGARTCVLAASERPEWLRAAVCRPVRAPSVADARVRSGCVLLPYRCVRAPSVEEGR